MSSPTPSTGRLDGKVALITGSSRGIGRQCALELASRGADIVINYSSNATAALEAVKLIEAMGRHAIAIKADVSQPASIVKLFSEANDHFKHIEIVVSNSGVESTGHISTITAEEFDRVFHVNTRGQLLVAQQAYKYLTPGGSLVMFSSMTANSRSVKNKVLYAGSKAAVEAFVRGLAADMGDKKIRVNAVAPAAVKTDMYLAVVRNYMAESAGLSDQQVEDMVSKVSPLGRIGVPEDVSRVVAFLVSEDGGWMNGQTLSVGGGAMI